MSCSTDDWMIQEMKAETSHLELGLMNTASKSTLLQLRASSSLAWESPYCPSEASQTSMGMLHGDRCVGGCREPSGWR